MVQINGEQQDVALVAGKTLLAYVTEAGYDPVGIVCLLYTSPSPRDRG